MKMAKRRDLEELADSLRMSVSVDLARSTRTRSTKVRISRVILQKINSSSLFVIESATL